MLIVVAVCVEDSVALMINVVVEEEVDGSVASSSVVEETVIVSRLVSVAPEMETDVRVLDSVCKVLTRGLDEY